MGDYFNSKYVAKRQNKVGSDEVKREGLHHSKDIPKNKTKTVINLAKAIEKEGKTIEVMEFKSDSMVALFLNYDEQKISIERVLEGKMNFDMCCAIIETLDLLRKDIFETIQEIQIENMKGDHKHE